MIISKFSRDGKRGFAAGSNAITIEKLLAGAITLAAGLLISIIGGIFSSKAAKGRKNTEKAEKAKTSKKSVGKKKRPVWLALLPIIYRSAKSKIQNNFLNDLASQAAETSKADDEVSGDVEVVAGENIADEANDIEVVNAVPITSEDEVYQHI